MTPVYPTLHVFIDADQDGVPEHDYTQFVVSSIDGAHGIFSTRVSDRIPSPGRLTFSIDNKSEIFFAIPNDAENKFVGRSISVVMRYLGGEAQGGIDKQIFYGYIISADVDSGFVNPRHVRITAVDWLHTANNTRVRELTVQTFKRADEALPILLSVAANPPLYTDFDFGTETFPNVFDGAGSKAKLFSELDKLTKSEIGYLYPKFREQAIGETLRLENRLARPSTRAVATIPANLATPGLLKYHGPAGATGYLKYHGEDAETGRLQIHETETASFDSLHYDADWTVGKRVVNEYTVTNIPRNTDTASVTLYELGSPIQIGTTNKRYINAAYTDPTGGTVIQAFDIVTPVASTDYLFNEESDGSGADLTANLIMNFTGYANNFQIVFFNAGPPGYLTEFKVRGKGIYKYNPIEQIVENVESKEDIIRTEISESMTREYSGDLETSRIFAASEVALHRYPSRDLSRVRYHGNTSEKLLLAFMYLEQGDKVALGEIFPPHDGDFYIQGLKWRASVSGILDYDWYVREEPKTLCTPIAVLVEAFSVKAIDFGILSYLANLTVFSYSFWIRLAEVDGEAYLVDRTVDEGAGRRGNGVSIPSGDGRIHFDSYKTPTDGSWRTTNAVITNTGQWYHVVVTYDNTTDAADPIIYIDGTAVAITELLTPSGTSDDDSDCPLVLFNSSPDPAVPELPYSSDCGDLALKDVRIYGRILTQAEVTELAGNEDDYDNVQDGLLFSGIFAPTDNIGDYTEGETIENDDLVLEIVYGTAGIPYNHDTSLVDLMLTGEAI